MARRFDRAALVGGLLLLTGCPEPVTTPPKAVSTVGSGNATPTPKPSGTPKPKPSPSASASVVPAQSLIGRVELAAVPGEAFKDNAAAFRVQAVPAGRAVITLSTLEDGLLPNAPQGTTTDAEGRFTIPGPLPTKPYVVHAALARNHRLSAIVLPEVTEVTLDEASSMLAATARFQVRNSPPEAGAEAGRKTLEDITFSTMSALITESRKIVSPDDFPVTGTAPEIPALQNGATYALRNLYVAKFGSQVAAMTTSGANKISDIWLGLLGYRPVAVTRVAGSGQTQGTEGAPAKEGALVAPISAVEGADGHLYITERDSHRIRIVPKTAIGAQLASQQSMTPGNLYTLAGTVNGPKTLEAYNAVYQAAEQAAVTNPASAPKVFDDAAKTAYPLLAPHRLLALKSTTSTATHLMFTSAIAHRVFLIPGADFSRFGRQFQAGRLYTLAGTGAIAPAANVTERGDNGLATAARLYVPTGLASDNAGNLYVLDAGTTDSAQHGLIRVIRATDGRIVTVPLLRAGQPFRAPGAQDIRLVQAGTERFLYVTDTLRHCVFRVPMPADLTAVTAAEIQVVLGTPDSAGAIDTAKGQLPDQLGQGAGVADDAIKLSGPTSLEFDNAGNMLVADAGNGRLLALTKAGITGVGKVHVIGGAFKSDALVGDARLVSFPQSTYLQRDSAGHVLLPDVKENTVRKLWTGRGTF